MLERTDAITNEVLEPITFVLAYLTVLPCSPVQSYSHFADMDFGSDYLPWKMYFGLADLRRWMTKGNASGGKSTVIIYTAYSTSFSGAIIATSNLYVN